MRSEEADDGDQSAPGERPDGVRVVQPPFGQPDDTIEIDNTFRFIVGRVG